MALLQDIKMQCPLRPNKPIAIQHARRIAIVACRPTPAYRRRQMQSVRFSAADASASCTSTELGSAAWEGFADAVTGEWSGISVTYNAHGEAQEIPYQYVPDAFREWGQVPSDWHTQCSNLATNEGLLTKLKRLMPIVGCEADAVAYNEEVRNSLRSEQHFADEPKTILPDGTYSTGPRDLSGATTARLEHCLVKEEGRRARIVFNLKRHEPQEPWKLQTFEVHTEARDQKEYNSGASLAACGYDMPTFSDKKPLDGEQLQGSWEVASHSAFELDAQGGFRAKTASGPDRLELPQPSLCLGDGVWIATSFDSDSVQLQSGWLVSPNEVKLASRTFSKDRLTSNTFITAHK